MLRVMIAEYIASTNKGEATLLYGIRKTIEESCESDEIQFTLCSSDWENDHQAYGSFLKVLKHPGMIEKKYTHTKPEKIALRAYAIAVHFLFYICQLFLGRKALRFFTDEIWETYLDTDVILIGHDNSFSKYHLPLILFSRLLKKKVIVFGATIMPTVLDSSFFKTAGRFFLNKTNLITTREPFTFEFLKEIGVNKPPMFCTADKAFVLDPAPENRVDSLIKATGIENAQRPLIGVMLVKGSNVFEAAFGSENMTIAEKYHRHAEEIATALDKLSDAIGGSIIFIPHSIGPEAEVDDRIVHRDVAELMRNNANNLFLLEDDFEPSELKGLMGRFDMVISERTHGGIASATMTVPTLWISHPGDIRTHGIIGRTIDIPDCIYDIRSLDGETLFQKMEWLWHNRESVKNRLRANVPKIKELTMKNGEYFRIYIEEPLKKARKTR
jgi:polysaccharide pyruvyl transferase WcaK-like protein